MSIKLGDHTVVVQRQVRQGTDTDDYGNPVLAPQWRELRWCQFSPTRASEGNDRSAPAISGATLLAPPQSAADLEAADVILYPFTRQPDGAYTGRRWEVLGEVGQWDEAVECQLRRLV